MLSLNRGGCYFLWSFPSGLLGSIFMHFFLQLPASHSFPSLHFTPGSDWARPQSTSAEPPSSLESDAFLSGTLTVVVMGEECYSLTSSARMSSACQSKILQCRGWNWARGSVWTPWWEQRKKREQTHTVFGIINKGNCCQMRPQSVNSWKVKSNWVRDWGERGSRVLAGQWNLIIPAPVHKLEFCRNDSRQISPKAPGIRNSISSAFGASMRFTERQRRRTS